MSRPVPLAKRLQDHRARRHVDAQRQSLGGVDDLDQSRAEELLNRLLEHRQQPRVMRGNTALQGVGPEAEAEDPQVTGRYVCSAPFNHLTDPGGLRLRGQVDPGTHHLVDGLLAAGSGEDEDDGGKQPRCLESLDDLEPRRRLQPSRAGSALAAAGCACPTRGALPGLRPPGGAAAPTAVTVLGGASGGGGTSGLLDGLEQLGVERWLRRLF